MAADRDSDAAYSHGEDTTTGQSGHPNQVRNPSRSSDVNTRATRAISTPAEVNQGPLPLRFIDEFQRQSSPQVKREIRSHVRRDTHSRQKRLNEASKPRPLSLGRRSILQKKAESIYPSSIGRSGTDIGTRSHSSSTSPDTPLQTSSVSNDALLLGGAAEMGNEITSSDRLDFPLSHWQFNNTTPYALLMDENTPFLQVDARTWPFPQPIRGNGPAISVWMPQKSIPIPDARVPRPCLLRSAQIVPWIAQSVDYFVFKSEVIEWVNRRLLDLEYATSDVTIGVMICLMSWEIARGNISELKLHIAGLSRIINLRGGPSNITSVEHFCWKIALIDLLVAVVTGNEPKLSFAPQEQVLGPPAINSSIKSLQLPDSSLYCSDDFTFLLSESAFCEDAVLLLQYMRDLTTGTWREDSPPVKPPTERPPETSSDTLLQIICAASSIYRRAFNDPPIPFSSPLNTDALCTISRCLEDTRNDETWIKYPGILLWVVLTALAAAIHHPQCSFFAMFAFRVGTSAAWWGPREARAAIMKFLDVKRRSDGVSRQTG